MCLIRHIAKDAAPYNEHFVGQNDGYVFLSKHQCFIFRVFVVALV